ncbi:ferritin-like domain-containing protein [Paenarthrobacter sp. NPDC092416]|uniref:ferritin-like domain-containing protein n=1 Tax=Paenarthrobacter sp. NPDC092416 TaxID=3364386 RepID=UPI003812C2F2
MNQQPSEKPRTSAWTRVLLVSVVALLVAGTGIVLIPRDPAAPPAVPFSESARMEAFDDAMRLRDAAGRLLEMTATDAGADPQEAGLAEAVTLLTTQSQALLAPAGSTSGPSTTLSSTASQDGNEPEEKPTRAALLADLAESGQRRLGDATAADGGIARLLAAVGTAQLLQSEKLAAQWQLTVPELTSDAPATAARTDVQCPTASPSPDASAATTDSALAATVRSEQEAVYVYQVALKRLGDPAALTAAKGLAAHEDLLVKAEALTRENCGDVPTREAGYRLPEQFAEHPAASLGALEASSLPGYGDLIALSTGNTRAWAIEGLMAASRRALGWGAALSPLPGLDLDAGSLPPLPTPTASDGA